jgi:hypothetical protein
MNIISALEQVRPALAALLTRPEDAFHVNLTFLLVLAKPLLWLLLTFHAWPLSLHLYLSLFNKIM